MDEATLQARDRAVLHHQGTGQGHRPRPLDGARPGGAVGRRACGSRSRPGVGTTVELWLPVVDGRRGAIASAASPRAPNAARRRALPRAGRRRRSAGRRRARSRCSRISAMRRSRRPRRAEALDVLRAGSQVDRRHHRSCDAGHDRHRAGAAASAEIRPGLPVILATGYAELPQASALPRLDKPYRQKELAALLETLLERHVAGENRLARGRPLRCCSRRTGAIARSGKCPTTRNTRPRSSARTACRAGTRRSIGW